MNEAKKITRKRRTANDLAREAQRLAVQLQRVQTLAAARAAAEAAAEAAAAARARRTKDYIILGVAASKLLVSGQLRMTDVLAVLSDRDREWIAASLAMSPSHLSRAGGVAPAPGGVTAGN